MRRKTQWAGLAAVAAGLLALSPALAAANSDVAPTTLTFGGSQPVGTTSAPQTATVTVSCTTSFMSVCIVPGTFVTMASTTGDFAQTNTCGNGLSSPNSCVFTVTFKPTAPGLRTGTLATGFDATGSSPSSVTLTGAGVPAPSTGGSGGSGTTGAKKKCKKKHKSGAQIAKKCKKK
jgi:hypothetical protein